MFCLCNADGEGGCASKICHLGRDVHCVHVRLCHISTLTFPPFLVFFIPCTFLWHVNISWLGVLILRMVFLVLKEGCEVCVFGIVDGFSFSTLFEYQRLLVFKMNVEGLHWWIFLRDVKRQNMPHSFI